MPYIWDQRIVTRKKLVTCHMLICYVKILLTICCIMYKNINAIVGMNAFIFDRITRSDIKNMIMHSGLKAVTSAYK